MSLSFALPDHDGLGEFPDVLVVRVACDVLVCQLVAADELAAVLEDSVRVGASTLPNAT